ncbi:uncharacterized protein LOC124270884 [Haliotis rubra]|uniref:uncharacterized protein LOC124270884 n=1 Tax=Haliotis rubra TaxID=36100 RepID=UPI001EE60846|nr:uncharacterized protein LOC124270884 [Haliotis rubra]
MKEICQDNIVLTYMGVCRVSNICFLSQCKTIHQILEEATDKYFLVTIPEDEKQKFIVRNWTKTDLYLSRKATAHRAHSGCLIIVAEKSCRNDVNCEVKKLEEQYTQTMQLQDDLGNLPATERKRNCSLQPEQYTSCHLKWEPVQELMKGDGKMISVQQLEDELSYNEPVLKGKFRLYEENGKLHVVAAGDYLTLVKKKVEQVLHWKKREGNVAKKLPNKELELTEIQFEFIQKPEVINYIDEKVESFQFDINRKRKSLKVYGVKYTLLDTCIKYVSGCLKEKKVDLSGEPVVENVPLSEIKHMLDVQESLHHGKLLIRVDDQKQCLNIICTDDVQDVVFAELHELIKTYSNTTLLLPLSSKKWGHIKTFPEVFPEIPKDVRTEYCSEQGLQIMGQKEQAIEARAIIEEFIGKLHIEEFPLSDDIEKFQTDEGQELIKDIQKNSECVVTIEEHETCENEASEVAIKDYLAELHLEQTSDCIRLSQWLSKGKCMITVIQGSMDNLYADILAVPVVGGEVPSAFSSLKKDESLKKRIQSLNQTKDQSLMIQCDNYGLSWLKTKRVVFFFVPVTLKEGKDKEKESVRKTVQHIITQEARRSQTPRNSACVFVVETLNQKGLFAVGVKAIIHGSQDAFEECVNCIDVQLLADETMSSEVVKTLKRACPESKQISLSGQVKKSKKKFPGKGKNVEQSKTSIEIVVGKLENVEADVLVNSAHHMLDLAYGVVSRALNAASKGQLQRECKEKYPNGLQPGEVAVTSFQRQKGKSCIVIHGFLFKFPSGLQNEPTEDDCWKVMYKFIYLCLHEASKLGVESIAFPVLGTGTLKYPVEKVANVMFTVVEWFFNETTTSSLKTVKFVVYEGDKDIIQVFDAEWMARSYESSAKQGSMETRQKCENVMLQFIASDIRKCNGCSDFTSNLLKKRTLQNSIWYNVTRSIPHLKAKDT